MKVLARIVVIGLLTLTAIVLIINFKYLYTTPIPNSYSWWYGDETWVMAQYNQFVRTGSYVNPFAYSSQFAQCSGLLFGSCYLTSAIYGLPSLIIHGHTIDTGRTITWVFSILLLLALWTIAGRYRVGQVLRTFGCLMLASTMCFFVTSHSARYDLLVGLTILIVTGSLPLILGNHPVKKEVLFGLLLPMFLLVNGHVLIFLAPMIGYLIWASGILKRMRSILLCVGIAVGGFLILLLVQWLLLGSFSLLGPFNGASNTMPIMMIVHPKSDLNNLAWRLTIANLWAPAVLWISIVLVAAVLWAGIRYKIRPAQMGIKDKQVVVCASIVVLSSVLLEFYWARYFIYVLPTIILSFVIVFSWLIRELPRTSVMGIATALTACLAFALFKYVTETTTFGAVGETITAANTKVVTEALAAIHSRFTGRPRIFSAVPCQAVAMDDSCDLITPVIFDYPGDRTLSRQDIWKKARIDYAMVLKPANPIVFEARSDTTTDWPYSTSVLLIFERTGTFSDIDRPYDPAGLRALDTLRVYEFK